MQCLHYCSKYAPTLLSNPFTIVFARKNGTVSRKVSHPGWYGATKNLKFMSPGYFLGTGTYLIALDSVSISVFPLSLRLKLVQS